MGKTSFRVSSTKRSFHIAKLFLTIFTLALLGCAPEEDLDSDQIRGDDRRAIKCYQTVNDKRIYNTAAKFRLAVPVWMSNLPFENEFNSDCEITKLKLHFAYIDDRLIPVPHSGSTHPGSIKLPEFYDKVSFYLNFKGPEQDRYFKAVQKDICSNKNHTYDYPEYGFRLCPYLTADKNRNINTFPFFPRFEVIEEKTIPTSFTCRHEDINGYTLENIYEMDVPYSCRGYWYWRKGASSMFDISKGKVLKKVNKAIIASEALLNSWIIE
ncbi:hypothetical protein ACNKU7_08195 [Microbulbifer sp. SA54]|uniref:hypothetical protein n=1 Tax=Microbulbifer sp. SA54 TaxID=3401577 RepID=UPI003AAE3F09